MKEISCSLSFFSTNSKIRERRLSQRAPFLPFRGRLIYSIRLDVSLSVRISTSSLVSVTPHGSLRNKLRGELMVSWVSNSLRQAALTTSLLNGSVLLSQEFSGKHRSQHAETGDSAHQQERLSPYIALLSPQDISTNFARHLIARNEMSPTHSGVALNKYHLIFVSWDERGLVLDKSVFQSPRSSHSAVIALRTTVEASQDSAGHITHRLQQRVTVISFLPSSTRAIRERVRVDLSTLTDLHGSSGTNWQGLSFLFKPNTYLGGPPMVVSASNAIPVPEATYWAVVKRAAELDYQGKPYHVLSSTGLRERAENCITGVAGITRHLPDAPEAPFTGPLRGQAATDLLATAILEASDVRPNENCHYEAAQDAWILRAFIRNTPEAQSGIRWYTLHK